jgi:hypothetical protein
MNVVCLFSVQDSKLATHINEMVVHICVIYLCYGYQGPLLDGILESKSYYKFRNVTLY